MKPYILEQTNWKQVKNQKYEVAILPWGATEPHNYHLPYGTDSLETAKIASEAAEKAWGKGAKIMVLPTIPLGVQNPGQIELPFCLHTRPSTQKIIFEDIVRALYNQGIRKLVLMNGHGGNDFKPLIREIQPQFPEMLISLVEWFKLLDLSEYFEEGGDHAGEMETSVIMHYFPELVLPLKKAGDGKAKQFKLDGYKNKTAWTPRHWGKVTKDTGIGNPQKASAEKGERYLKEITSKISDFYVELAECNLKDLYE
ncbi:MAG: creatininase family protein [Prolixibacteraceae bacterium]|jgi:creatinine amidohydrolase|nr:creatininase family protein [Prolixibacteraceae bacterium]MBT6766506.1 creatininase family protein [Prolixibacteraceae bacterium]MBT6997143.1 creatininase family protein [Prolixibacteraceae bacterium]MBT7393324.1 creatininase family protein [Prolixibacteraceae bacterium]